MDKQQKDMLILEPKNEVVFEGPLKTLMESYLTITNPDEKRTAQFKIKTTAPKTYFVRPNVGQLKPNESIKVQITMQSFLFEREKHKFLVQAAYGPNKEEYDPNFWKDTDPKNVWNFKLKSVVNMNQGGEFDLHKKNVSEAAQIVGIDNDTIIMGTEHVPDVVHKEQNENNSDDEYERDTRSKSVDPEVHIEATKPTQKTGFSYSFYIASFLILVAAVVGGYYCQNVK